MASDRVKTTKLPFNYKSNVLTYPLCPSSWLLDHHTFWLGYMIKDFWVEVLKVLFLRQSVIILLASSLFFCFRERRKENHLVTDVHISFYCTAVVNCQHITNTFMSYEIKPETIFSCFIILLDIEVVVSANIRRKS